MDFDIIWLQSRLN